MSNNNSELAEYQRIKIIRSALKLSQQEFAEGAGITQGGLSQLEKGVTKLSFDTLQKISISYSVNCNYLVNGIGEPFLTGSSRSDFITNDLAKTPPKTPPNTPPNVVERVVTVNEAGRNNIVLVDQKAAAGYLQGFRDQVFIHNLPAFSLPGFTNASFRAFEIEGKSMEPTLCSGDWVICRQLEAINQVKNGAIHILVTQDGSIAAKRLYVDSAGLSAESDNYGYQPYSVPLAEVKQVWAAVGFISRNLDRSMMVVRRFRSVEADYRELRSDLDAVLKAQKPRK
jgi:transcriptional regulator with XRE-family HTH domain